MKIDIVNVEDPARGGSGAFCFQFDTVNIGQMLWVLGLGRPQFNKHKGYFYILLLSLLFQKDIYFCSRGSAFTAVKSAPLPRARGNWKIQHGPSAAEAARHTGSVPRGVARRRA